MSTTTFHGLTKPAPSDLVDISVISADIDLLDGAISNLARFVSRAQRGEALTVCGLGDSIMAGTGATLGVNDYMTLVSADLTAKYPANITFHNYAISGYTMATLAIVGQITTALAQNPDLLIISLGRNDVVADQAAYPLQGYKLNQSMRATEVLIREVRRRLPQCDILIHTENPSSVYAQDGLMRTRNAALKQLADVYGCQFTDGYAAFYNVGNYSSLMYDDVHPNVAGHTLHANTINAAFPTTAIPQTPLPAGWTTGGGLYSPQLVDPTLGNFGWQTIAAPSGVSTGSWVNTGDWTGTNPAVTSTASDYAEFTFYGTELAVKMSTAAVDAAVVDIKVDGVTTYTDQSMTVIPSVYQPYVVFAAGLATGMHTVRLTLKSGTLRIYAAAWLRCVQQIAAPGIRRMKPGRYYSNAHDATSATGSGTSAGYAWVVPLWVPTVQAFDRIAINITAANASSTLTLGIYGSDEYDQPSGLIVQSSPIALDTTGWKEATISTTLQPGYYWLAELILVSTAVVLSTSQPALQVSTNAQTFTNPLSAYLATGQSALPSKWTSTTAAMGGPLIGLRAA